MGAEVVSMGREEKGGERPQGCVAEQVEETVRRRVCLEAEGSQAGEETGRMLLQACQGHPVPVEEEGRGEGVGKVGEEVMKAENSERMGAWEEAEMAATEGGEWAGRSSLEGGGAEGGARGERGVRETGEREEAMGAVGEVPGEGGVGAGKGRGEGWEGEEEEAMGGRGAAKGREGAGGEGEEAVHWERAGGELGEGGPWERETEEAGLLVGAREEGGD